MSGSYSEDDVRSFARGALLALEGRLSFCGCCHNGKLSRIVRELSDAIRAGTWPAEPAEPTAPDGPTSSEAGER